MAMMFRGLGEDTYDRQYTDRQLYARIWDYFVAYRQQVWAVVWAVALGALMLSVRPLIIAAGVGVLEENGTRDALLLMVAALGVSVVVEYVGNYVRRRMSGRAIGGVIRQLRQDGAQAAVARDLAFYDTNKSGKIVSRITSDTQEFGTVILLSSDVIAQLISAFVLVGILFTREWRLSLLVLAMTPVIVAVSLVFRYAARITTRRGARATAEVNGQIQESVAGIRVAKNFRKEATIFDEFRTVNTQSYDVNLVRGFTLALLFPVMNVLAGFALALVTYLATRSVLDGAITAATWFVFVQTVDRFWFPFIQVSAFVSQFQQGLSAAERIFALIDADNSVTQTGKHIAPQQLTGAIVFDGLTFGYSAAAPVLQDFDLHIRPGENVAFVGHTGAGKSTIAKLIGRFYEFQEGALRVDDTDIRDFDVAAYRKHLGIVSQTPFLFSGTVADNIRYGRPDATDAEIEAVARSVGDGEWLDVLPNGLATDVGERGALLSMGQRQLISLMRVLLQRPAIFILDEATASVDPFTEIQIQEALDKILAHSTSILIAHRLSTVRSADRIIVLQNGGIIEQGSHDQLMAQGGHYAELYNTYFRHQSLDYVENARRRLASPEALPTTS